MKAIIDAYLHLGDYILNQVKDDNDQPVFIWVDRWNEQIDFIGDDGEANEDHPFSLPACFIDFDVQTTTSGLIAQDGDVFIDIYTMVESLEDTYIGAQNQGSAFIDLITASYLHRMLEGYANPLCGMLTRQSVSRYKSRSNVLVIRQRYKTVLRDLTATEKRKETVTVTFDAEPMIVKRPHRNPDTAGSGEKYFDIT